MSATINNAPLPEVPRVGAFLDTIAAPRGGALGARATLAPPVEAPRSQHAALRADTVDALVGTMHEMRIDIVERNADFAAALTAVAERAEAARRRLDDEVIPLRRAQDERLRAAFDLMLSAAEREFSTALEET
jgi:hypothetical protein